MHAWNHVPNDGLKWKAIHRIDIQQGRHDAPIPCGPGGVIHDYVPFYFGYLSPMMLNLKTGRVEGYSEGQEPLIYLKSTAQAVEERGTEFVFSDGHGLATFTSWYEDLKDLDKIDWDMVYQRYWLDTDKDMDRQRRKQAEFLVYRFCDWKLIDSVVVMNRQMKKRAEQIMSEFPKNLRRLAKIDPQWYYL